MLEWFSHQRRKSKPSYFGTRTSGSQNLVHFAPSAVWYFVIYRGTLIERYVSLFKSTGTVSDTHIRSATADRHRSQAPEDHRCRTGTRHFLVRQILSSVLLCKLSNADNPLPFNGEFCYISLFRDNFQSSSVTSRQISMQYPHLTVTKKA